MTQQPAGSPPTPSVTIVIPTRERHDTLVATLRSCLHQNSSALTILVVDNFSQDSTADVVASFNDPRIRYENTGRRLAMSANWEFALGFVNSDYVLFLGDDDALLPHAVEDLMALLSEHPDIDAISWPAIEYGWPSCQLASMRDVLIVPLTDGVDRRSASATLADVIAFKRPYAELPFLYKGLVRVNVIDRLRFASGGAVFHSRIPDVYFGIASCAVVDQYLYSFRPYTVNGASGHSNGTSSFAGPEAKEAEKKFLSEDNIAFHATLQFCPSIPILVIESLLQARARLPALLQFEPDLDAMVAAALEQVRHAPSNVFAEVRAALDHIARANSLTPQSLAAVAGALNVPAASGPHVYGLDVFRKRALLDATAFGVGDCFSAALFADSFWRLNAAKVLSCRGAFASAVGLLARRLRKWSGIQATRAHS